MIPQSNVRRPPLARAKPSFARAAPGVPAVAFLWLALVAGAAAAADVRIGYQTGVEPAKLGIPEGAFERASGATIDWRRFDNGAEVLRAVASGDLDIGSVGSSVVATAAGRQLAIETFLIGARLGASEALVARRASGIAAPADLIGKTVAVPFVTTCHYSLLAALKHWGIDRTRVKIVNLRVSEIPAAWARGDIDAAYVWDPALGRIKPDGRVLATSIDVAQWGAPTFDVWIVRKEFSAQRAQFLSAFVKTSLDYVARYGADPKAFDSAGNVEKIARASGAKREDIAGLLAGNAYPQAAEQRRLLDADYPQALALTAAFLKEQGKLDAVLTDYRPYSTSRFLP
jgi:taurine transport system substrate-binding protein